MKKKVLLIDDDRVLGRMLQRFLENAGLAVYTAINGKDGVRLFKKEGPQIVILDYIMPEMDGVEVLRRLQSEGIATHSVIMLASDDNHDLIRTAYELGVHAFVIKPVNFLALKGMIMRAFDLLQYAVDLNRQIEAKERAFHLLQTTVDNIAEGVITLDRRFRIRMLSVRAGEILHTNKEEAYGKPIEKVIGSEFIEEDGPFMQCVRDHQKRTHIQVELEMPNKIQKTVALSIYPMSTYEKHDMGWILLFRDLRKDDRMLSPPKGYHFGRIISADPRMREVFELIEKVAQSQVSVLVEGESGTGKELVAREIHDRSQRRLKHFHAVNCAAIPPQLLESEFFGHERGSFTGADQLKRGRFELADGGTLFLDEIGEMPLSMQGKLLRVLQERKFERVGGTKTISVDVRIVAATNKDLKEMVKQNKFREDLYYRLRVVPISLPPLRERILDLPHLVNHFINMLSKREKSNIESMDPDALQHLMEHHWPGNIRELVNVMEYCFIVCRGAVIEMKHLPKELQLKTSAKTSPQPLPQNEREYLLQILQSVQFKKGKAADKLGINPSTLYRKLKRYGI